MSIVSKVAQLKVMKPIKKLIKGDESSRKISTIYSEKKDNVIYNVKNKDLVNSIEYELRINVHIIEKCLVKKNTGILHNTSMYIKMLEKCNTLFNAGVKTDADIINEVMSAISASNKFAIENNVEFTAKPDVDAFCKDKNIQLDNYNNIQIITQSKKDLLEYSNYESFIKSRHSIREYNDELILEEDVKKIIELAMICPSACNRQPCKVYYTFDKEKILGIRSSIADQMVARGVPNFLVVTVKTSYFNSTGEAFQEYINGGIFLNSLVNSIHNYGYGSCLFQTPRNTRPYARIKEIIGLPVDEDIVCVVGYGKLNDTVRYIATHRKDISGVTIKY